MGLLIAGGMLIPGNIPNIVVAGRLKISVKEWAAVGLPLGLALMAVFLVILLHLMVWPALTSFWLAIRSERRIAFICFARAAYN